MKRAFFTAAALLMPSMAFAHTGTTPQDSTAHLVSHLLLPITRPAFTAAFILAALSLYAIGHVLRSRKNAKEHGASLQIASVLTATVGIVLYLA